MADGYPQHQYLISHFGLLLRYLHERPDSDWLMAKGERFDEVTMQWVPHPIGIGYYENRSWDYSREEAKRRVEEYIAELSQAHLGAQQHGTEPHTESSGGSLC